MPTQRTRLALWAIVAAIAVSTAAVFALGDDVLSVLANRDEEAPLVTRTRAGPESLRRWEARGRYLNAQGRVRADSANLEANYRP